MPFRNSLIMVISLMSAQSLFCAVPQRSLTFKSLLNVMRSQHLFGMLSVLAQENHSCFLCDGLRKELLEDIRTAFCAGLKSRVPSDIRGPSVVVQEIKAPLKSQSPKNTNHSILFVEEALRKPSGTDNQTSLRERFALKHAALKAQRTGKNIQ